MNVRALIDEVRSGFVADGEISPTRSITYSLALDATTVTLNSYVGNGIFSKEEKETIGRYQAFGGLSLLTPPEVNDIITSDGQQWKVIRYVKFGNLYTVYCENKRHNARPKA